MFHAARAILWHDGYREKSHYCVARYLEAVYIKKRFLETEWVDLLDYYRDLRHDDSYSTSFTATEEDCKGAVKTSKKFVKRMKELLSSIKN